MLKFIARQLNKRPTSLRKGIFFLIFFSVFIAVLAMSTLWVWTEVKNNKRLIKSIKESILQKQKNRVKGETQSVLFFIRTMAKIHDGRDGEQTKQVILEYIQHIRFGYSGYVFVNTFEGNALVFDGKKVVGTKDIKNIGVGSGTKLFSLEMAAAKNPQGAFIQYSFKKINDSLLHPKISFISSYKPWGWIIGAGDYIDDAQLKIVSLQLPLLTKIRVKIKSILLVLLIITIFLILVADFVAKQLVKRAEYLIHHLENPEKNPFDANKVYIKELRDIVQKIVAIETMKSKVENELREHQIHLELLVKERTEVLEEKNKKLESFNDLFVNREFRIKELRDEIKELKAQLKNNQI